MRTIEVRDKLKKGSIVLLNFPKLFIKNQRIISYFFSNILRYGVYVSFQQIYDQINPLLNLENFTLKNENYERWLRKHLPSKNELVTQAQNSKRFKYKPKISIIIPIHKPGLIYFKKCVESVLIQSYPWFEICIAGGEFSKEIKKYLDKIEDKRIKIIFLKKNKGISKNSNEALNLAEGEFVGLLDQDDELTPNALYEVVKILNENKNLDLVYSDEDKILLDKRYGDPFFKPNFDEDLLLGMSYTPHFNVYRRDILEKVGRFRKKYDGCQDYDLLLRVSSLSKRIFHVPKILYHWRVHPDSVSFNLKSREKFSLNSKYAIEDCIEKKGILAEVLEQKVGRFRVKYKILGNPKVSIILLTSGNLEMLKGCLKSIFEKTSYKNYEIVIVDTTKNGELEKFVFELKSRVYKDINYLNFYSNPFNYSKTNNYSVKRVNGKYIVLLNDDTRVKNSDWIEGMLEHAQRKKVGVVGCKLFYPNGRIQHAGIVFGIHEVVENCFRGIKNKSNYDSFINLTRQVSAVTSACCMIPRNVYEEIGGFDEKGLFFTFSDVDFCYRARKKGYKVIYTPYSQLYHFEAVSKKEKIPEEREINLARKRFKDYIQNDPFYNPNLTRKRTDWTVEI